jgi:hypothetical protein
MAAEQLEKLITHLDKLRSWFMGRRNMKDKGLREWLDARLEDKDALAAARRRLVDQGVAPERLLQFPAYQVLLLDEKREYETRRDEAAKLMNLPTWQAVALLPGTKHKDKILFNDLLLDLQRMPRLAQARLEQQIALLQHVEGLRLYAAEQGKLPEKLADVAVPLPPDPFTGKPFRYQVEGTVAHLRGTPPPGLEKLWFYNVHFEVTIRK